MIKSITLKNWKSFGEATLYVDPLTVLIGTNASGKSNFLDALVFL
ncbi:MAG: AAA family ATPase, partial [Lewinella sp.]